MTDIAELDALMHARNGDPRPLARLIREGGAISEESRAFIADFLESAKPPRPRGHPRPWHQQQRDVRIAQTVRTCRRNGLTKVDALEVAAEAYGLSADRIEKIVKDRERQRKTVRKREASEGGEK